MKYQDIEIEKVLERIKERISSNQMSLLVGSGASCCACDFYQNWVGLVTDMVAFLYQEELERKGIVVKPIDGFYCHYSLTRSADPKDNDYVYDTIKAIVNREGVLEIPSKFARRMGVRESIEAYIESHTPHIDYSSNTISLFGESCFVDKEKDLFFLTSLVNVGWNAIFTTNYDDLLKYSSLDVGKKSLTECSDAAMLSLRMMDELVIKLHGSIDFNHQNNGFDGDVHRKYVLTHEDYKDYPSKHEAFMQLMRISLLKDCFCLVGFSGSDPNFIAWITWVRDILESKRSTVPESVDANDIKIFFIDCFDSPLDDATLQFFENHKIYRIVLPKIKPLLKAGRPEPKNPKDLNKWLLDSFFTTIKNESQLEKEQNDDMPESYTLWSQASKLSGSFLRESTINVAKANELLSMSSYMRIVRGTHYQSYYLDSIPHKSVLT